MSEIRPFTTIMEERWDRLLVSIGCSASSQWPYPFETLCKAYAEKHRFYHTLEHIAYGLDVLDRLQSALAVKMAFWWHDVIYKPGFHDNELKSAELFNLCLGHIRILNDGISFVDEVKRLILITKDHRVDWFDKNGCDIVVADLRGLAENLETYKQSGENIRQEYSMFTDDQWRVGRADFLSKMAARRLFPPSRDYDELEYRAKNNMARESEYLHG